MKVTTWWASLCVVAAINITVWLFAAATVHGDFASTQLVLSGIYVAGCAYRSALPVYDIPRIGVVDSWASSVLIGRSVATCAELAFAAQWAVYLHDSELEAVRMVSLVIVPAIAIAQLCCWHSVLTTKNLGHVFENSLWGICAALIVASLVSIASQGPPDRSLVFDTWVAGGALYVLYIFVADVPMYWNRWKADEAQQRQYMTFSQGFMDLATRRVVSRRWEDWRSEVTWMTLYFTTGVWVSLSLIGATR